MAAAEARASQAARAAALGAEPEPEPAPGPLDTPIAVLIAADGESGELLSFRALSLLLRSKQIDGDSQLFVPPVEQSGAQRIGELVDMDEVAEMDDEDTEELAASLRSELTPEDVVEEAEATLVVEGVDALSLAAAACAPPLRETARGHLRAAVELPPALAAVAERELGETAEVRTAALAELLAKMEAHEAAEGVAFRRKDEQFRVAFLRVRKYRIDDALRSIIK